MITEVKILIYASSLARRSTCGMGTEKPIEEVKPGDMVVSYDSDGRLVPGKVSRTFENHVRHILDVHGLMITPGHVTFCAEVPGEENPLAGQHVPILDNPMETPFIPNWRRVNAAFPDLMGQLRAAVEADNA